MWVRSSVGTSNLLSTHSSLINLHSPRVVHITVSRFWHYNMFLYFYDATGSSADCDCGISWLYSFTIFMYRWLFWNLEKKQWPNCHSLETFKIDKLKPTICTIGIYVKGIYLSKALTCMKFFLYKQKLLFYQGDGYLWPHCCMNNLYISHRLLYAPTYSFWAIDSMLISRFWVTSWFNSVCNIVTCCIYFREKHLHKHELQLSDYNMGKYFRQNVQISGRTIYFSHFCL